jgi:hypothetical protein
MHGLGNLAALQIWIEQQSAEGIMLSHCANLHCLRPFLRLGQGKLFLVEASCVGKSEGMTPFPRMRQPPRRLERYWLCDQCAAVWTLVHDRQEGIALLPLQPPVGLHATTTKLYQDTA